MAGAGRWAALRRDMVDTQCRKRGITDERVLAAMERVPREEFVPPAAREQACGDHALLIGLDQTISQPFIVACMSAAARVQAGDRVLDVGTGSGYQAAVLAELGAEVHTIERLPELAQAAQARLHRLGYGRIRCYVGDGSLGLPEAAPFDAIVAAAAAPSAPAPLLQQLADGGRLVVPVGHGEGQVLECHVRHGDRFDRDILCGVRFVPLLGAAGFSAPPA